MHRVKDLESQIETLSPNEFRELRAWLALREAELWDRQFDADVHAGRLDAIVNRALDDFAEDRSTEL